MYRWCIDFVICSTYTFIRKILKFIYVNIRINQFFSKFVTLIKNSLEFLSLKNKIDEIEPELITNFFI